MRLVLEGGGSRAVFAAGVLMRLMEAKVPFTSVVGSSTGAMVAAYFAAGQREELEEIWCRQVPEGGIMSYWRLVLPSSRPCIDLDYLVDEVFGRRVPLDRERATTGSPTLYAVGTDVRQGRLVLGRPTAQSIMSWLKGAAAFPVGYGRPVESQGHLLMDGGLIDSVPYRVPLPDQDPEEPIVVVVTRRLETRKPPPALWQRALVTLMVRGKVRELIRDQHTRHNELMDQIASDRERGLLAVVEPPAGFPVRRMTQDAGRLRAGLQAGLEAGAALLDRLSGDLAFSTRMTPPPR